ncbi:MAG: hypothetical protein II794_08370, partial [Oscillospiraceae bacterium]|nr:hypothetical protein [Oscillospiraceae bacterium]
METKLFVNMVQAQIGYTFKKPALLFQAFTRRSYAEENGGEDNEILEFIGDKALDLAVIKLLTEKYGQLKEVFSSSLDEGELTQLKSRMVQKKTLAGRIDKLGFASFLLMGKGDEKNNAADVPSVKEDLFEAIVGAVALDCNWDFSTIVPVVDIMISAEEFFLSDYDDNYVRMIYEWEEQKYGTIPLFWLQRGYNDAAAYYGTVVTAGHGVIYQRAPAYEYNEVYYCDLKVLNDLPVYRGWGPSKSKA